MTEEVKPEIIKKTQDSLKKYIKKPPLTEKLLKKPPFRFLHDIVTNVITETGFLNGLFSSDELNHENIKDRDGKVAFLDKLISAVKIITGIPLSVRATKIVAGHEPTKTNELLQAIGVALDKKLDSKDVAQQLHKKGSKTVIKKDGSKEVLKDSLKSKPSKNSDENKNTKEESSDRKKHSSPSSKPVKDSERSSKSVKQKSRKDGNNHESRGAKQREKVDIPSAITPNQEVLAEAESKREALGQQKRPLSAVGQRRPSDGRHPSDDKPSELDNHLPIKNDTSGDFERPSSIKADTSTNLEHHSSIKADASKAMEVLEQEQTSTKGEEMLPESKINPSLEKPADLALTENIAQSSVTNNSSSGAPLAPVPLARPRTAARVGSARPGAPRVRSKGDATVVTEELIRPPTVNLIVDADSGKSDKEEEDENLVIVETTPVDVTSSPDVRQTQGSRPSSQQGQLVAQILETQKELNVGVNGQDLEENFLHHTEIEWEAGKKRERESAAKEMERMRALVQNLTRAAHPLGKLLDSLQEDVDNMNRELLQWQNMQTNLEKQLKIEESLSAQATQPLKEQLKQLQQAVRSQLDQLSASKANILNNDSRIHQLLTGGQGFTKT